MFDLDAAFEALQIFYILHYIWNPTDKVTVLEMHIHNKDHKSSKGNQAEVRYPFPHLNH